jgi:endonuclease I
MQLLNNLQLSMKQLLIALLLSALHLPAQIPPGYYDNASGLTGDSLRLALHDIIKDHNIQTYSSLWTHFQKTDLHSTGKVWDIYSDIPGGTPAYSYTFVTNQCGNYAAEGDCYNREHTVPSSWSGTSGAVYTDLFHLYPTDGFVNGKRANFPYGEVASPSWTSTNGSKLGNNAFPGYTGTVFEPIDPYKGDIARTYFYMAVRYLDKLPSWTSAVFSGDSLTSWSKELLLKWHYQDTISQKELDRNDSIYKIQGNRNPFIDHPQWVTYIWDVINTAHSTIDNIKPDVEIQYTDNEIRISNPGQQQMKISVFSLSGVQVFETLTSEQSTALRPELTNGAYVMIWQTINYRSSKKIMVIR